MKLCRFHPLQPRNGAERRAGQGARHAGASYGIIEAGSVFEIDEPFERRQKIGIEWPLDEVRLLPPCEPSKIVCVGRNYREHSAELRNDIPREPLIFLKPPSSILAPGGAIVLTAHSERIDYEGELAVVIGKRCARLRSPDEAWPYVLGYTCLNDVTARDLQKRDVQFTRAKSFDTFCPFGPFIESEIDLGATTVETFLNSKKRQSGRISEMIFPLDAIIQWISQVMTLLPGDVIATGTPAGVGPLAAGDVVEISVSGIGTLHNDVTSWQ